MRDGNEGEKRQEKLTRNKIPKSSPGAVCIAVDKMTTKCEQCVPLVKAPLNNCDLGLD